jgi:MFS family permease
VTAPARPPTLVILTTVVFNLITYTLIGLPLAVFPPIVHQQLGYSAVLAGFLISLQYAATLVTRAGVGRMSDSRGAKYVVIAGLAYAAVSGVCILAAALSHHPSTVLAWLAASRLWLGAAESGTGTGCIAWGIGRAGGEHTAAVMSWNGVASYGGIALGAPLGVLLHGAGGLTLVAAVTIVLPLIGLAFCVREKSTAIVAGTRMKMSSVFRRVLPFGIALALGSIGFGTIVAFITLYYASHGWNGAAYALSAFGVAFVAMRILFAGSIQRYGGFRPSLVSFAVEFCGLAMLWLAPAPWVALLGATFTGLGMSLIFPSMAVEALRAVPVTSRGAAIGTYTVFLDISLGVTGPAAGLVIGDFGYPAVYLLGATAAACAGLLTAILYTRAAAGPDLAISKNEPGADHG